MNQETAHFAAALQAIIAEDGHMVPLRPQTSDVLRLLVANAGRIVSKSEILSAIWGDQAVTEDVLYQCVSEIRRAFGKCGIERVRTVSRKGYTYVEPPSRQSASASPSEEPFLRDAEPISYVRMADGVDIAWTASGRGVPLLKTTNFISHLGAERRSRLYVPFYERLGRRARIVRYDQRGGGLSNWHVPPLTIEAMCEDMLAVADAAKIESFFLFGYSQGVAYAVAFAARYPDRVLGIIGRGGYAQGRLASGSEVNRQTYDAAIRMIEIGWDSVDRTYQRHFTSRLMPDAPPEMARQ